MQNETRNTPKVSVHFSFVSFRWFRFGHFFVFVSFRWFRFGQFFFQFRFVGFVSVRSIFFLFRFVGFVSVNFFFVSFRWFRFGPIFFSVSFRWFRFGKILFLFRFGGFDETNRNPKPCVFETMVSCNTGIFPTCDFMEYNKFLIKVKKNSEKDAYSKLQKLNEKHLYLLFNALIRNLTHYSRLPAPQGHEFSGYS